MKKVIMDVEGGDFAPYEIIEGIRLFTKEFPDVNLVLVGNEKNLVEFKNNKNIEIIHTDTKLDMGEEDPVKAYRLNKNSSLFLAMSYLKNNLDCALVSAGPTQAMVLGGHLILKRLEQIRRIALSPFIPSFDTSRILLDVGANSLLRPEHLLDFAIMGSIIFKNFVGIKKPKVGLLNIGSEPNKGRELETEAYNLLSQKNDNFTFIGNVESKEIFTTEANIIVTDGYSGNICLKTMEGTAKVFSNFLKQEIKKSFFGKIGALFMYKTFKSLKRNFDTNNLDGALLLGLNGIVVKIHGSSKAKAVRNGILQAYKLIEKDTLKMIKKALEESKVENGQ